MVANLAPNPYWIFRDSQGRPAYFGTIETYRSLDHDTEKAVWKDKDETKAWTNPVPLDAAGGVSGLYWSADEDYFIVVKDQYGNIVDEIDDFNSPVNDLIGPDADLPEDTNYFLNPQFRFFLDEKYETGDLTANTDLSIAAEGWFFRRNNTSSNISLEFKEFAPDQKEVPFNPKYYLNFLCSSIGAAETEKDIFFRINDVQNFGDEILTASVYGKSTEGDAVEVLVRRNYGSGGSVSSIVAIDSIILDANFTQKVIQIPVDSFSGITIGDEPTSIDFIFRMPLNDISDISLTNFQLNIGDTLRNFDYKSYDMEKIRVTSYNLPAPSKTDFGATLVFNGVNYEFEQYTGSIYASSTGKPFLNGAENPLYILADGSTFKKDDYVPNTNNSVKYGRLYEFYENNPVTNEGNYYGYGNNGFKPMIYDNIISFECTKNETAIPAWTDNDTGFTIENARNGAAINVSLDEKYFYRSFYPWIPNIKTGSATTPQNNNINRVVGLFRFTNTVNGVTGASTLGNLLTHGFEAGIIREIVGSASRKETTLLAIEQALGMYKNQDVSASTRPRYFTFISTVGSYYVWYRVSGVGTDPAPGGTGIPVDITPNDSEEVIVLKTVSVLNAGNYGVVAEIPLNLIIENNFYGSVTASTESIASGIPVISDRRTGSTNIKKVSVIRGSNAETLTAGDYVRFHTTTTDYVLWIRKNGAGVAPGVGTIELCVDIKDGFTTKDCLKAFKSALLGRSLKRIITTDASTLSGGEYLLIENSDEKFTPYVIKDGSGADPSIGGRTSIPVNIATGDTDEDVASKFSKAISSIFFQIPNFQGVVLRGDDPSKIIDKEYDLRLSDDNAPNNQSIGRFQGGRNESHKHGNNSGSEAAGNTLNLAIPITVRAPSDIYNFQTLDADGGTETRMANVNINYYIKI
jgi:hypothetical protein